MATAEVDIQRQPRGAYRDYSPEFKAEALLLLKANDGNLSRTAAELNIPRKSLEVWTTQDDRYGELRQQTRASLDAKLDLTVHKYIDSIYAHNLEDTPLQQKATAFGIVFDKLQLVRNLPTNIVESIERQELTLVLQSALDEAIDITPE